MAHRPAAGDRVRGLLLHGAILQLWAGPDVPPRGPSRLRILALNAGFLSNATLIITRPEAADLSVSGWTLLVLVPTLLYAVYGLFASMAWPPGHGHTDGRNGRILGLGNARPAVSHQASADQQARRFPRGYWTVGVITLIWVVEHIAYFTMIQRSGPVTTAQAVYVASPAGVLVGAWLFGERIDVWLILCLLLLLAALYLNNRALAAAKPVDTG